MKLDFTRTSKTIYTEVGNRLLHKHSEVDVYDAARARVVFVIYQLNLLEFAINLIHNYYFPRRYGDEFSKAKFISGIISRYYFKEKKVIE